MKFDKLENFNLQSMASPASSSGSGGSSAWTIQQSLDEPRQLILALLPKFKSNSDVTHILSLKAQMDAISEETKKKLNASMENIAGNVSLFYLTT